VPELEPVAAWRVVASPAALDAARWRGTDVEVIRIAPDEALGLYATGVDVDDDDAIAEADAGYSAAIVDPVMHSLADHSDVPLPSEWNVLVQGKVAGVPVKLLYDDPMLLVVQAAYADELRRRLGW